MSKIKVGYINNVPFSVGFGGKEIQLLAYESYINTHHSHDILIRRIDHWNKASLKNIDILHLFGLTKGVHTLVRTVKSNTNIKIILSPNFYVSNPITMKVVNILSNICPIPNIFQYRKEIFQYSDEIIVNSCSEKQQLLFLYPKLSKEKLNVLHNGIENNFNNLEEKDIFLKRYNIEAGYFLSVSFLDERKNTINLIKAFLETLNIHNKKLVLIGSFRFNSKEKQNTVEKLLRGNTNRILHIPYIDREANLEILKSAYHNCFSHLLPSILETPGISNLEALSYGNPILVGKCPPVIEYFSDLNNVIYCNPLDIKDIAEKISFLVNHDIPASRNANNFIWEEKLISLPEIYNEVFLER